MPKLPPPHDPDERVVVEVLDRGWDVRVFSADDKRRAYFVPRGFWHLQLWNERARLSVLTPSRLTGGRFELRSAWGRQCFERWSQVASRLRELGISPPDAMAVARAVAREVDDRAVTTNSPGGLA